MNKFIASALFLTTAYFGFHPMVEAAPGIFKSAEQMLHSLTGYSAESCASDPVACLNSRKTALEHSQADIRKAISDLETESVKTSAIARENEVLLAKNNAFLEQGKTILNVGLTSGAQTFEFASRRYPDAATFRAQLETLFAEKSMIEKQVNDAHALQAKLDARLQQLRVQQGKVQAAIAILPSQISLLQANASLTGFEQNLDLIETALKTSDDGVKSAHDLIGNTQQLSQRGQDMAGLTPRQRQVSEAFDRYLMQ